jgi:hypothetical protein
MNNKKDILESPRSSSSSEFQENISMTISNNLEGSEKDKSNHKNSPSPAKHSRHPNTLCEQKCNSSALLNIDELHTAEVGTPKRKTSAINVTYTPNHNPNDHMSDQLKDIRRNMSEWSS